MPNPCDNTIAQLPEETLVGLGERILEAAPDTAGLAPLSQAGLAGLAASASEDAALGPLIAWVTENRDVLLDTYPGAAPPFDHLQSYWENFYAGPRRRERGPALGRRPTPAVDFLGHKLGIPFGVPACAVTPHSRFVGYFAHLGFDLITYKTVRGMPWNPHPSPNLAFATEVRGPVDAEAIRAPIHPTMYPDQLPAVAEASFVNSIGVPSLPTEKWAADIERTIGLLGAGQLLIVSVMGSPEVLGPDDERGLVEQFVSVARSAAEAGAPVLELNLSCPNTGGSLICLDPALAGRVTGAVRRAVGDTPVLVKISYMPDQALAALLDACRPHVDGIVAINAVQVPARRADGSPFFDQRPNDLAGLSGVGIRDLGLAVTRSLSRLRGDEGPRPEDWVIVGIGGVNCPEDYQAYRDAGADAVQSCTGAWLNPDLAAQVGAHVRGEDPVPSAPMESSGGSDEGADGSSEKLADRLLRLFHAVNDSILSGGLNTRVPDRERRSPEHSR